MPEPDMLTREPVAILMGVYAGDRREYLEAALESLFQQTYQPLHIYVGVDGPVPSDLEQLLSDAKRRYADLYVLTHAEHRYLAPCLNDQITALQDRYAYFARMDADDVSYPNRIQRQVDFLETHPLVDAVGGAITDIDEHGRELKRVAYPETHEQILRFFRKRNPVVHVTMMFRSRFFSKAGLYPTTSAEDGFPWMQAVGASYRAGIDVDGLYWMQAIRAGCQLHNLKEPVVYVRRSGDYLRRRTGLRKCWAEFLVRLLINRNLGFGPAAFLYALGSFGVQMMPVRVKHALYDHLR